MLLASNESTANSSHFKTKQVKGILLVEHCRQWHANLFWSVLLASLMSGTSWFLKWCSVKLKSRLSRTTTRSTYLHTYVLYVCMDTCHTLSESRGISDLWYKVPEHLCSISYRHTYAWYRMPDKAMEGMSRWRYLNAKSHGNNSTKYYD